VDELWQRYRTFWTPVLIGMGAFLVGLIVVHIMSDDPKVGARELRNAKSKVRNMKQPDPQKARILSERGEALRQETRDWAARIDQADGRRGEEMLVAAEQALRAAILRGAPEEEAASAERLKVRFDGDAFAADKAYKRFLFLKKEHGEALQTGDPNVAGMQLLTEVWNELRVRANRADVEIGPAAVQLGFGAIGSVSRATLPSRVLNLALVARIVDCAIRNDVERIDRIGIPTVVDPGSPQDFIVLWPVDIDLIGSMAAVKQVLDMLTDPAEPVPIENSRLLHPKKGASGGRRGLVHLHVKASSAIVRPDVPLNLDQEEDK